MTYGKTKPTRLGAFVYFSVTPMNSPQQNKMNYWITNYKKWSGQYSRRLNSLGCCPESLIYENGPVISDTSGTSGFHNSLIGLFFFVPAE